MTVTPLSDGAPAKTTAISLGVMNALTRQWKLVSIVSLLILAFTLAFLLSDYRLFLLTMTLITAIAVLGLNILVGYNGQLSLGHGAIYALGAYVTAVLTEHAHFVWWATLQCRPPNKMSMLGEHCGHISAQCIYCAVS